MLIYKILVKGYPLKEVSEFDNWKKIQDFSGRIGWVSKSQLSSQRYVISVMPDQYLYKFPTYSSKKIAFVKVGSDIRVRFKSEHKA